jgi:hypothetical protein
MSAIRIIFNWGSSDRLSLPINYGRVAAPMAANSEIGVIAAIPHPRWTTTRDTDKLLLPSSLVASTVTDTDVDPRSSAGTRCGGPEYGRDLGLTSRYSSIPIPRPNDARPRRAVDFLLD